MVDVPNPDASMLVLEMGENASSESAMRCLGQQVLISLLYGFSPSGDKGLK